MVAEEGSDELCHEYLLKTEHALKIQELICVI